MKQTDFSAGLYAMFWLTLVSNPFSFFLFFQICLFFFVAAFVLFTAFLLHYVGKGKKTKKSAATFFRFSEESLGVGDSVWALRERVESIIHRHTVDTHQQLFVTREKQRNRYRAPLRPLLPRGASLFIHTTTLIHSSGRDHSRVPEAFCIFFLHQL